MPRHADPHLVADEKRERESESALVLWVTMLKIV